MRYRITIDGLAYDEACDLRDAVPQGVGVTVTMEPSGPAGHCFRYRDHEAGVPHGCDGLASMVDDPGDHHVMPTDPAIVRRLMAVQTGNL